MKTIHYILVAVLIISGLIPVPIIVSCLSSQDSAAAMLNLGTLTPAIETILLINGAFMLSFVILFWVAAIWVMQRKNAGITLSLILGAITAFRGILLFSTFNSHQLPVPFIAMIAAMDGVAVIVLSLLAGKVQA